jgi:hypothetical protein
MGFENTTRKNDKVNKQIYKSNFEVKKTDSDNICVSEYVVNVESGYEFYRSVFVDLPFLGDLIDALKNRRANVRVSKYRDATIEWLGDKVTVSTEKKNSSYYKTFTVRVKVDEIIPLLEKIHQDWEKRDHPLALPGWEKYLV